MTCRTLTSYNKIPQIHPITSLPTLLPQETRELIYSEYLHEKRGRKLFKFYNSRHVISHQS